MKITELTIILDKNDEITAVQVRDEKGVARGLALNDLPGTLSSVNEAALLSVAELEAVRAQLAAYKARGLQAAQAVLDAKDKETCDAIALDIKRDERERNRLAALQKLAEAQAEAAKYAI